MSLFTFGGHGADRKCRDWGLTLLEENLRVAPLFGRLDSTMAIIGLPPVAGMARANCCQAGLPMGVIGKGAMGKGVMGKGPGDGATIPFAGGGAVGASFGGAVPAVWLPATMAGAGPR